MERKKYDSTVARIAGNLLSGAISMNEEVAYHQSYLDGAAKEAVRLARAIVAEVERTEPQSKEK